jgi:hypothetical protein
MKVCWFSAGVSSFISAYLESKSLDKVIYIDIADQHDDSMRFVKDCEKALGREIEILRSPYESVDNVIQTFQFINSRYGAKCTDILKKRVRKEWELDHQGVDLEYVWGYDCTEEHRATALIEAYPEHKHNFPLIDRTLNKADSHGICREIGVKRPIMYDLGYQNNNCRGCVKGGMWYWNKIRVDFPEVFNLRAKRERQIEHTCLTEKKCNKTVPLYLDELEPNRGRPEDEVMDECSMFCMLNLNN